MSDTFLHDFQDDIAERLRADEVLGAVNIITERTGDIAKEISRRLGLVQGVAGTKGACIVVMQLQGRASSANYPAPLLELDPVVRVLEHPSVNTTLPSALVLARRVSRVLWHYTAHGSASPLVPANPMILGVDDVLAPVAYDVQFTCHEAEYAEEAQVILPRFDPPGGAVPQAVAITSDTEGAEIWYTADGSHPRPGNPKAVLYTGPITVNQATRLRAGAFLAGAVASSTASAIFE